MPAQFPKIAISDLKGNRDFRRRSYRKTRKGDILRISRVQAGSISPNELASNLLLAAQDVNVGISSGAFISGQLRAGHNSLNGARAKRGFLSGVPSIGAPFPSQVFTVLSNLVDPVTDQQLAGIINFVTTTVNAGVFDRLDHYNFFTDSIGWTTNNANTDWINGRTSVLNNSPVLGPGGYLFNGVNQYIDTQYNPDVNGENFFQNDASMGLFMTESGTNFNLMRPFGTRDGAIWVNNALTGLNHRLNSTNTSVLFGPLFQNDSMYAIQRDNPATQKYFLNGAPADQEGDAGTALIDDNVFIAARNNNGSPDNYWDGRASAFFAGGSLTDMQHAALYGAILQLQIDFGI